MPAAAKPANFQGKTIFHMQFTFPSERHRHLRRALSVSKIALFALMVDGASAALQAQVPPVAIPPDQQLGRPESASRSRGEIYRQGLAEERALTVFEREHEGYEPLGARIADEWVAFAGAEAFYEYNNNIFTTPNGTKKDSIFSLAPTVRLRSDMPLHQLNVDAGGTVRRFADNDSEDTDTYFLSTNGRYDFSSTSFLFGRLGTSRAFEDRSSPNAASGSEPTEYQRYDATVGMAQNVLRLTYQADLTLRRLDYKDVPSSTGTIDQDGRDVNIVIGSARAGWEWQEGLSTYVRGAYNTRDHFSTQTTQRDSSGFDVGVGVTLSRSSVYMIDASLGVMHQTFDNAAFDDVTKPSFSLNGAYNITPLTSLVGGVSRSLEETTTANASSLLQTVASVGVEHEIMLNLLGRVGVSYTWSEFQGLSREDEIVTFSGELKYLFNRNFYLSPRFQYSQRESPVNSSDYEQWRAVLMVGTQL